MRHIFPDTVNVCDNEIVQVFNKKNFIAKDANRPANDLHEGIIQDLTINSGRKCGLILQGNTISLNFKAYEALKAGENESIVASYSLLQNNGAEIPQTACFTVMGTEQDPVLLRIL